MRLLWRAQGKTFIAAADPRVNAVLNRRPPWVYLPQEQCFWAWTDPVVEHNTLVELCLPPPAFPDVSYRSPVAPWPWQREALERCLQSPCAALFMDMRTGKTKVIVDLTLALRARTLVVVKPKPVVSVWQDEAARHGLPCVPRVAESLAEPEREARPLLVVTNYEWLWRDEAWFQAQEFDVVAFDEATALKHTHGGRGCPRQCQAAVRIARNPHRPIPRRYILTGWPITQSPIDLYGEFYVLDPGLVGYKTLGAFEQAIAYWYHGPGYKILKGYRQEALDALLQRLSPYVFQVRKQDVMPHLPPRQYHTLRVELPAKARAVYDKVFRDFVAEYKGERLTVANVASLFVRLQQITGGWFPTTDHYDERGRAQVRLLHRAKIDALLDLLDSIPPGERVVVWFAFQAEIEYLAQAIKKVGRPTFVFYGGVADKLSQDQLEQWRATESAVLLAHPRKGGFGIDLAEAGVAVYYSCTHSVEARVQSEERLCGPAQAHNSVLVYDLVCQHTVDEAIRRYVADRQAVGLSALRKWDALHRAVRGLTL